MERFVAALRRVSGELDLPRRARTELLLEMAADLEAVYEHHRARGAAEGEAVRRAEEAVLGSSEVIRRLGRLHARPWLGWAEELAERLSGGLDLVLFAVGVLPILVLAGGVSVLALAADPSAWALSILLIGSLMTALVATEALRLLRDRPPRRANLPSLLVLTAMAPALGLIAPVLGIIRGTTALAGEVPEHVTLSAVVVRDGATLVAGLLLGIGGLLAWFVLHEREARRGAREVDALLADDPPTPAAPGAVSDAEPAIPLVRRRHG